MKKYLPIFFISIMFTACFNSSSLEDDKEICVKENKFFYVTEV